MERRIALRGVFLAQLGAGEAEIEEAFCEAIRTAKQQKSVSLAMRAEASYAEYRSQKSGEKSLVAASGDLIASHPHLGVARSG